MDNEKIFEFMTKMYNEMQEGFKDVKSEIAENRNAITKLETKIENEIADKIRGLYDNREVVNNKLDIADEKLDNLQRSVNDIGIKTLVTDNKLIDLSRKVK